MAAFFNSLVVAFVSVVSAIALIILWQAIVAGIHNVLSNERDDDYGDSN